MPLEPHSNITAIPLRGGMVTVREPTLLRPGTFSMVQNMRPKRPGFVKRPGQRVLHTTADSTNKVLTAHQFVKNQISETHTFGQFSDGDILEATATPPTVTTGVFGDEVFSSAITSQRPAAWGQLNDLLIHSNGVDQHKVYAGKDNYVRKFVKHNAASPPPIPVVGIDYTDEVTDGLTTTSADLSSLAASRYLYICSPVPANRLTWAFATFNTDPAIGTLKYRKSDGTWADTTETDGTIEPAGDTMGKSGSMYWSPPSDEVPHYMYGVCGFWYQWETSATLDASVTVTKLTYGTDHDSAGTRTSFLDIVNTWDGLPVDAIEVHVFDNSAETYSTFGSGSVNIGGLSFDENDKLYICSLDPLAGLYIDPGDTPNTDTTSDAAIASAKYWDGDSFETLSNVVDKTVGSGTATLGAAGFITWGRPSDEQPQQFGTTQYYGYWYEIILDDAVSTDVVLSIQCLPYFDIDELGKGVANCSWQDRMCYSFSRYGQYIHVSDRDTPMVLNGPGYGVLEAGDGRTNQVLGMSKFHNEMIAWQEEKGIDGGCTTLFEGYAPGNYGKLLLSSRIGIVNSKAHTVVDGVLTSTATDEKIKTLAFWISRYGICASDGQIIALISDDIQNYFDPQESECIRRGYEDQHFIGYDSSFNLLRVGLVSGAPIVSSTATSTTTDKLTDTAGAFTTRKTVTGHTISANVEVGDTVYNTTDGTTALVTVVDSATALSLDTDIMASGESYQILSSTPNLFLTFDLTDKCWYGDRLQQNLSYITEVEAGSGQVPIVQIGGGTADGTIYQLNYGQNDVSTLISSHIDIEFSAGGLYLILRELLLRCKVQDAGDITLTLYGNKISAATLTWSMTAEIANEVVRRHLEHFNIQDQHITVQLQHATASENMYLYDLGIHMNIWGGR